MSHPCDTRCDVYEERSVRARKEHQCAACGETIRAGDIYVRLYRVFDGAADTTKRCVRCQRLHVHLRDRCTAEAEDLWPDERLDCGEDYRGVWDEEPPDHIAALAFATPDEMQRGRQ